MPLDKLLECRLRNALDQLQIMLESGEFSPDEIEFARRKIRKLDRKIDEFNEKNGEPTA